MSGENDADVDWEGERRWSDGAWLSVAVVAATGCAVAALGALLFGAHALLYLIPAWAVLGGLLCWQLPYWRRRVSRELGITEGQLPVVARRLRAERVPNDPTARRAMALLAVRQRKQIRGSRRIWVLLTALYVLGAVVQFLAARPWLSVVFLCAAALTAGALLTSRATLARLLRVEEEIGPRVA